jgi:hypothetical protein
MPIYLFFDESGNLDFGPSGSRYYIFGALTTRDPVAFTAQLSQLRYDLLGRGIELEAFHASEDRQVVRNAVLAILAEIGGFEFDTVLIEKSRVDPGQQEAVQFYPGFARHLLSRVFQRYRSSEERIVIVTDTIPLKRHREAVKKAFKSFIRNELGKRPFSILHHSSAGHSALQAADYCTWAIHKKTTGELRPYNSIKKFVRSELHLPSAAIRHCEGRT